jgi:DNA replication protein DnaC
MTVAKQIGKHLSDSETEISKCQVCNNTGWENYTDHNGYEIVRKCKCDFLGRQVKSNKLEFASIPAEFSNLTVENFATDVYQDPELIEKAMMAKVICSNYVNQFEKIMLEGKGLYLYSNTKGSGKTRMAVSIANDVINKYMISAKFATSLQILDEIKASWSKGTDTSEQKLIQDITRVPLLVIDDIGVERNTDWINERFYSILNGRMIAKQVTIFTSNCKIENLKFDDRIINRIAKMTIPVAFPEKSIRTALAKAENSEMLSKLIS